MATGKTSTVTFRIAPALKEALRTAADHVRCLLLCCAEQFTRRFSRVVCSANTDEAQRVAEARTRVSLRASWPRSKRRKVYSGLRPVSGGLSCATTCPRDRIKHIGPVIRFD